MNYRNTSSYHGKVWEDCDCVNRSEPLVGEEHVDL